MSSSPVTWSKGSLGQNIPVDFTNAIANINNFAQTANQFISYLEGLVNLVSPFLGSPSDVLMQVLQNYLTATIKVLDDLLSFGGSMIFIHPWNRINLRSTRLNPAGTVDNRTLTRIDSYTLTLGTPITPQDQISIDLSFKDISQVNDKKNNIGKTPLDMFSYGMTPREAFSEFYASFTNTKDTNRPIWTSDTQVIGFGILLTAPDISSYQTVIVAFSQFLKLQSSNDLIDEISKVKGDFLSTFNSVVASGAKTIGTVPKDIVTANYGTLPTANLVNGTLTITSSDNVKDTTLPSLHWYSIQASNFPFLKDIRDLIDDVGKQLLSYLKTADSSIQELIKSLIKRIDALRALVTSVTSSITNIILSLESAGIYTFSVPQNYGGALYIQKAIQDSLNNPSDANSQAVAQALDATNYSALFFAGCSTGFDTNAWKKMFQDAWVPIPSVPTPTVVVTPDFKASTGLMINTPYKLTVACADTASWGGSMFFTYTITDPFGSTIIQNNNLNVLNGPLNMVNTTTPSFTISNPGSGFSSTIPGSFKGLCSVTITAYNSLFQPIYNYSTSFSVYPNVIISVGCNINTKKINSTKTIYTPATTAGTPNTGGDIYIGGTYVDVSSSIPVSSLTGFQIISLNKFPIPNNLKFSGNPMAICFSFTGVMRIAVFTPDLVAGATPKWTTIALPGCFILQPDTQYIYEYLLNGAWVGGPTILPGPPATYIYPNIFGVKQVGANGNIIC